VTTRDVIPNVTHPPRGRAEYAILVNALDLFRPRCRDLDLFTKDAVDSAELAYAKRLCAACPIRGACHSYAEAATPPVGIWAGTRYTKRGST
jgi:hypothetical protein